MSDLVEPAPASNPQTRRHLYRLGLLMVMAMLGISRLDPQHQTVWLLALMGLASTAYVASLWLVARRSPATRKGLLLCLLIAAVWRIPLLIAPPTLSDDVYRYIWDGRVQRFGVNPYAAPPDAPELARLHTPVTRLTSHPRLPTIYPAGAEWFFRGVTLVNESVLAMKVALAVCDGLIVWLLLGWLPALGRSPWWVLAYAWNPLVAVEVAGSGHVDILGVLLLMVTVVAMSRGRHLSAALSFAAAVAVKFLPIVLVPILWRRIRLPQAVRGGLLLIALYIPFFSGGRVWPTGSLGVYLENWRFNGPAFGLTGKVVGSPLLVALPVLAGLATAGYCRWRCRVTSPAAWAWPLGVTLIFMPAVYPWYLLWLTPFLMVTATLPLLVWTQSVLLTYWVWHSMAAGTGWTVPWWVMVAEYGSVAAAGLLAARQGWTR